MPGAKILLQYYIPTYSSDNEILNIIDNTKLQIFCTKW